MKSKFQCLGILALSLLTACNSGSDATSSNTLVTYAPPPAGGSTSGTGGTNTPSTSTAAVWHSFTAVGSANADYATLSYGPTGSAFVGYSVQNGSNSPPLYDLYYDIQPSGSTFGSPVLVQGSGGILGSLFFQSSSSIWLSSQNAYHLNIYRTTDGGGTWLQNNSYVITDRDPSFNHSLWVDRGSGSLQLFAGYEISNYLGSYPTLRYADYTNGSWDAGLTILPQGGDATSLAEAGSTLVLPYNGGIFRSTDSGANFAANWSVGAWGVTKVGANLYAYDSSGLSLSTDMGATWTTINSASNLRGSMVGNGSVLLVASGEGTSKVTYTRSNDGGHTWSAPGTLADYTGTPHVVSSIQVALAPNGRIGLAYSIQDGVGGNAYGVGSIGRGAFFAEYY